MKAHLLAWSLERMLRERHLRKQELRELARALVEEARLGDALPVLRRLTDLDPRDAESWMELGALLLRMDRAREALEAAQRALELEPLGARRHRLFGAVLARTDDPAAALRAYAGAVTAGTADDPAGRSRFLALLASFDAPGFKVVVARLAAYPGPGAGPDERASAVALRMGNLLTMAGDVDGALLAYRRSTELDPEEAAGWANQGVVLQDRGGGGEALACLGRAAWLRGRVSEAAALLEEATAFPAPEAETCLLLARASRQLSRHEAARRAAVRGLRDHPGNAELHFELCQNLEDCGRPEEARERAAEAAALFPGDLAFRVLEALSFPRMPRSAAEAAACFESFEGGLRELGATPDWRTAGNPMALVTAITRAPRYLLYQERDALPIQRSLAAMLSRAVSANYPHAGAPLPTRATDPRERIRVGYLSAYLGDTAGSRWLLGWLEDHDRDRFELFSYHLDTRADGMTGEFRRLSDTFRQLPGDFARARARILEDRLDVLVWVDFAASALAGALATQRLAPVQCAGWGFPFGTGLDSMDYYLSSECMEPADGDAHYAEALIRLPGIGATYPRPPVPAHAMPRSEFGFEEGAVICLSLQSPSKYLPEHDPLFAEIAARVPAAKMVFLESPEPTLAQRFRERLAGAFASQGLRSEERCLFVPDIHDRERYLARYAAADLFLDTFGWSGCVTTLEALASGLPVITRPGAFRRARQSAGMLRAIGVPESIARDEREYVEIAVALGLDASRRGTLRERIRTRQGGLFGDAAPLRELERFYRRVAPER